MYVYVALPFAPHQYMLILNMIHEESQHGTNGQTTQRSKGDPCNSRETLLLEHMETPIQKQVII